MSFEGLQERLVALQESTTQLRELIDRLANLKFEPGSVPWDVSEESSVSGELSVEIAQILRGGEDEAELLAEEVEYLRPEGHEKSRLKEGVEKLTKELTSCRTAFRRARVSAKRSLTQAQKLERELMLQSFSQPVSEAASPTHDKPAAVYRPSRHIYQQQQQTSLSEEDQQTVSASNNVTNALRQTHDLIASELSRSEFAHQTLTESSNTLKQLNESYGSLDTMLASSKDLLGTLLRSQKSDTWYLQTTLVMLLTTAAWLFFRRILYGPMWWLVWLPLRVLFGVGSKAGSAVMRSGDRPDQHDGLSASGRQGKVEVDGLPKEDLPTADVGQREKPKGGSEADSMVGKVGKIMEEADELGQIPHDDEHDTQQAAAKQDSAQAAGQRDEL